MTAFLVQPFAFGGELLFGSPLLAQLFAFLPGSLALLLDLDLVVGGELELFHAQGVVLGVDPHLHDGAELGDGGDGRVEALLGGDYVS